VFFDFNIDPKIPEKVEQKILKNKWGKKGKRSYDYSFDPFTRIKDKVRFRKILQEELNDFG
jgi:hypothetical protein